jgi:hypothetical protein
VKGRSSAYPGRKLSMLQARGFNNFLSKDSWVKLQQQN